MRSYIFLFFLFLLFSCDSRKVENKPGASAMQDSAIPVKVTILANLPDSLQPETILLKNTPAPKTVKIPDKLISITINHRSGPSTLNISPRKKIKASFLPVMQNYSMEQGLAMDVLMFNGGFADKKGNLWFATSVGGVSKYDGHSFTNYTTSHGLSGNGAGSITEDTTGNIWFATNYGISKFDGNTFSTFGNFKDLTQILGDGAGNFWIGTRGNSLYKYSGDSITRYSDSDGFSVNTIYAMREDRKGILWLGTDSGLFRYDTRLPVGQRQRFTKIALINKEVRSILIDKNGNVWADTYRESTPLGLIKYNGVNITSYSNRKYGPIYEDHLGYIWFVGQGGIWYCDSNSSSRFNRFSDSGLGAPATEDKSGNLWFVGNANGVFKCSWPAFQSFSPGTDIRSIFEDKSGSIWFGGFYSISRFDGKYFTSFGPNAQIWCMLQDKSGITWIGSSAEDGLIKLENNSFTFYTDVNGLVDDVPRSIIQDTKGYLWIGTDKGISKFDGKSFTNFTIKQGLAGDIISCILEDKPGELFLGTNGGLSYFDGRSFTNYSISGMPYGNDIRSMVKDTSGNLWMGTFGGGLTRYDGKSFYTYTIEQGLPDNVVTQVALTKEGAIVVGTNNGIALLTGFNSVSDANNPNNLSPNKQYPPQNNLSNNELKHFTPFFEIYNPKSGYPIKDVNRGQHAIFQDSKGILWIASGSLNSGLMRFDYSSLFKNKNPPELNILSVKVNDELVCWHDLLKSDSNDEKPKSKFEHIAVPAFVTEEVTTFGKPLSDAQRAEMREKFKGIEFDSITRFYPVPQHLKLPYRDNKLTIEFAAIEPDKPSLVRYQYKLEGYDKNWSVPANITSATYGNIHEGTYHFYVKARSPSGIMGKPLTYSFTVLAPWWRTWWAYTVYALLLVFALRFFIKRRERNLQMEKERLTQELLIRQHELEKQQAIENVRAVISRDIHDEIGSGLTKISLMSQRLKLGLESKKDFDPLLLQKITESSKEIVGNLGEIIWTVNPKHDNLASLLSYFRNYIAQFFEDTALSYSIEFPDEVPGLPVHPDLKRNLFLVLKESLNNIVKHAHAQNLTIKFNNEQNRFHFEIADDGVGIKDFGGREFGNGLQNMKHRIESVNGSFTISTTENSGTAIVIEGQLYY
jgi:signal transduction histidine kinase/ligand-binding sensor domain-containing protein